MRGIGTCIGLCVSTVLLMATFAWAQQGGTTPPGDYGIGNTQTSPNSNVGNSPSFSPDQNQAMTGTRGSSTGDTRDSGPGFAGDSGQASADATKAPSATDHSSAASGGAGKNGSKPNHKHRKASTQGNTVNRPVYPSSGSSTTEAPGPATGNKGTKDVPQGGNGNYSGTQSQPSGTVPPR